MANNDSSNGDGCKLLKTKVRRVTCGLLVCPRLVGKGNPQKAVAIRGEGFKW